MSSNNSSKDFKKSKDSVDGKIEGNKMEQNFNRNQETKQQEVVEEFIDSKQIPMAYNMLKVPVIKKK